MPWEVFLYFLPAERKLEEELEGRFFVSVTTWGAVVVLLPAAVAEVGDD